MIPATSTPAVPANLHTFEPPLGLRNPHTQTILGSMGRKLFSSRFENLDRHADEQVIELDGIRLKVTLNLQPDTPLIQLIPGWLGSDQSTYAKSLAQALFDAGFSVARINLRDHGDTTHLNEGLFNSAAIEEVVALSEYLQANFGQRPGGMLGFSLGGNFALRVCRAIDVPTLSVCPAIDPADTMYQIDANPVYQRYFINKWRKAWVAKQNAFPGQYDFSEVLNLSTVSALTDYFVSHHTAFDTTNDYFNAYDLRGDRLHGINAHIIAAQDDPIIPAAQYTDLPPNLPVSLTRRGGHGAYLDSWRFSSWIDTYAVAFFKQNLQSVLSRKFLEL